MMVRDDRLDIDPKVFTPGHLVVIRAAAQEPTVQRIFVNAAIKKALCREAKGDRKLAAQGAADVRPRLSLPHPHQMPAGLGRMREPSPIRRGEGCKPAISPSGSRIRSCIRSPPKEPPKPKPPMTMAQLPPACRQVLNLPDAKP
jgi:penicillin-insensitive murein endopeptidase